MEGFNLVSFSYDEAEHVFNMELRYLVEDNIRTDKKQFKQLGSADLYLKNSKRVWLLGFFETWLLNIKDNLKYFPDKVKEDTFKNIWLIYEELNRCDLLTISERILNGESYLRGLLPKESSHYYTPNFIHLEQIISFCKAESKAMKF